MVHWKRNIFTVPSGKAGKEFVRELTTLFSSHAQASALERIALKVVTVASVLLLQKPHPASKCKDHSKALSRRLEAWRAGNINDLLLEGRTLQNHLRSQS